MPDDGAVPIRRAGPLDAPLLAELHALCFPEPWNVDFLTTLLAQPSVMGLLPADDEPAGFLLARAAAGEAEILTLAVRLEARRQWIALGLCGALLAELRRAAVEELFIEVAEDNVAALGLYSRLGFAEIGRRPRYYATAEGDALVLRLTLP